MAGYDSIPGHADYLQGLESNLDITSSVLTASLRNVSREPIITCKKLLQGETNEVYDVELKDGLKLIIRIAGSSVSAFERETWAIERCSEIGIPTPKILDISQMETKQGSIDACIQHKVPGNLLSRSNDTSHAKAHMVSKCGEWLREMHSIKTTGFGYIDGNGCGIYPQVKDEALEYQQLEKGLIIAANAHGFDHKMLLDALAHVVDWIQTRVFSPCLIHNDFEPKHILVSNQKINAIIDFGEASSGDPINDLVRFSFCDTGTLLFTDLLKGYGECDLEGLLNYRIGFALFMVAGCHAKGFNEGTLNGFEKIQQDWRIANSNEGQMKVE